LAERAARARIASEPVQFLIAAIDLLGNDPIHVEGHLSGKREPRDEG
jgi:hypothetical protein